MTVGELIQKIDDDEYIRIYKKHKIKYNGYTIDGFKEIVDNTNVNLIKNTSQKELTKIANKEVERISIGCTRTDECETFLIQIWI